MPRMLDRTCELFASSVNTEYGQWLSANTVTRGTDQHSVFTYSGKNTPARGLREAELYYVTSEMMDLVDAAHADMPPYWLQEWDLPSFSGLMYFERPFGVYVLERTEVHEFGVEDTTYDLHGVLWITVDDPVRRERRLVVLPLTSREAEAQYLAENRFRLMAYTYKDREDVRKGASPEQYVEMFRNSPSARDETDDDFVRSAQATPPGTLAVISSVAWPLVTQDDLDGTDKRMQYQAISSSGSIKSDVVTSEFPQDVSFLRYLVATWNLMRQPLVRDDAQSADRQAAKRARREKREAPKIRLIKLRSATGGEIRNDAERKTYSHRWVVRGHWRMQWYPSIKDHRPLYVLPHVKGPADAPLLKSSKVYVFKQ